MLKKSDIVVGTCSFSSQPPGTIAYFGKSLTKAIREIMPLSKEDNAPVYLVTVDLKNQSITIKAAKP